MDTTSSGDDASTSQPTIGEFLIDQLIVDLVSLCLLHPARHGNADGIPWTSDSHRDDVVFIARRKPSWQTNYHAVLATRKVLTKLDHLPPDYVLELLGTLDRLGPRDERTRRNLASQAVQLTPRGGIAEALLEYLPFTVSHHPDSETALYLDDDEKVSFSENAALLLLAWLISAQTI